MKQRKFEIIRDLPNCPSGRILRESFVTEKGQTFFFVSMTDDEYIDGKLKDYKFTQSEVESNPEWFREIN